VAEAPVIVVIRRTLLVMGRIAGFARFMAMTRVGVGTHFLHDLAGICRQDAQMEPGDDSERENPYNESPHMPRQVAAS
jgi:hypothetical protein